MIKNPQKNTKESKAADGRYSLRASSRTYLSTLAVISFFALFLIYIGSVTAGVAIFGAALILIPFFALNDHIVFDGKRIFRTGILLRFWTWANSLRRRLKLNDIEQVETLAMRAIKRGGKVHYRYRTTLRGKGMEYVLVSGDDDFRRMLGALLPRIPENVLDIRSIELRDYLTDYKETLMKAEFARIPPADVLESTFGNFRSRSKAAKSGDAIISAERVEKAEYLRILGNELRLLGYLAQAVEAFRRALQMNPQDGRLLMEFARCLHSFAGAQNNAKLERKSRAMMRLAERRAVNDTVLLERLGESYFTSGEFQRADSVFRKAMDSVGESFRAVKGLAELALREGKIAHVIHHFSTANRLAAVPALRRWSRGEADYFARLNDNDEYMDLEISRVNLLETMESAQKTTLRIGGWGIPTILIGILFEDSLVADIGWAVASVSLVVWIGLVVGCRMMSRRIPFELVENQDT